MVTNFAMLPPEANSGRLNDGPGPGTLIEAAAAWERLAVRLYTTAADYRAVTSRLRAVWDGRASTLITEAAADYVEWLDAAAARADGAATAAAAAVAAHETALAATVPPPEIEANRALRASLVATNCLGQNGPSIADLDADYEQMWARDAEAMYAYAGASAEAAAAMTAFASPPTVATPARGSGAGAWRALSAPEVVSAAHRVMSAIPAALRELPLSPLAALEVSLAPATPSLSKLSSLSAPSGFAISALNALNKASALRWFLPNEGGARGAVVSARSARAASIGPLSVPKVWSRSAAPLAVGRGTVA